MRPKERIKIFFRLIDWKFLSNRWEIENLSSKMLNNKPYINISEQWLKYPDMRFGQLLINLGLIEDNLKIWLDEEVNILKDQGVNLREFLLWGSIYDKDKNLLDNITYRLIKDLDTNHIKNILKDFKESDKKLNPLFEKTFKEELKLREELVHL